MLGRIYCLELWSGLDQGRFLTYVCRWKRTGRWCVGFTNGSLTTDSDLVILGSKVMYNGLDLHKGTIVRIKCEEVIRNHVYTVVANNNNERWTHNDFIAYSVL